MTVLRNIDDIKLPKTHTTGTPLINRWTVIKHGYVIKNVYVEYNY